MLQVINYTWYSASRTVNSPWKSKDRDTLLSSPDICTVLTILILEFSISNLLRLETLRKNLKNLQKHYSSKKWSWNFTWCATRATPTLTYQQVSPSHLIIKFFLPFLVSQIQYPMKRKGSVYEEAQNSGANWTFPVKNNHEIIGETIKITSYGRFNRNSPAT